MDARLVIDTSLNACGLGLFDGESCLFSCHEEMTRGQQERLPVMALDAFRATAIAPRDLTVIGVTLGPGSFTGVRVGLSFAKGLAAGAGVPLKGVGTLEALAHHAALAGKARMAVINGGRGQVYVQFFDAENAPCAPATLDIARPEELAAFAAKNPVDVMTGPAVSLLAEYWPGVAEFPQMWPSLDALCRLAVDAGHDDLTPLYMREADAIASTRGIISLNEST
ncbi:tRNA (adenosine(37)-N6)-threonylcarbamoyltransferase complex dimerization subunit type 1 TsaB [Asticcacaulis sp. 201]|uniref:tRNA (adenosine(37)-N6)-threonylcarbamoyltransferase complex dimerization subunit type 1 TsaB n=1 Tax=Asticcacaulis sp. 201 TaxID=3028787 RepID=UPI0029162846|nr:tRNA (adenosine(37)-N6)-threonylcarbamoyltransferase complex dimerization subunit type 1 TsaB [Asticcacaulis sp. 201]MDV6331436.1 tRNA (adenosine(37)-N6)-threonylcarbamoyltransferase complex dimerization subunit type 1 TsaB [Asticcacaulis sp. 201]